MPYEKLKREPGATAAAEGVDTTKLEVRVAFLHGPRVLSRRTQAYLRDEDFERVFSMSKEEFYQLPGWRQRAIKINRKLW